MKQKRLLAISSVALAVVAILAFIAVRDLRRVLASTPAAQTDIRKIKVVFVPTAPIRVTEVLWNGVPVSPDSGIPSGGDWVANLQIKFKNISDKPISFARIMVFDSKPTTGSLALIYGEEYETDTTKPTVAPNAYGVAHPYIGMYGRTTGTSGLKIEVNKVVWDFNYDLLWSADMLWELDKSPNAPSKYKEVKPTLVPAVPASTPSTQAGKAARPNKESFVKAGFKLNHAPAIAAPSSAAAEDYCFYHPDDPACEELGPFCDAKLSDASATQTCSSLYSCGGAGQPHCFNSGCHPTGPATCAYNSPSYSGIVYNVTREPTVAFCYDVMCPTNICGDNVNHTGYVSKGTTFPSTDCRAKNSPIIVDTKGDGIKLTSAAEGTRFDLNVNGKLEQTAWTQAGGNDAFLVLDRDGDGMIKNGSELFGDNTEQPPVWEKHGFLALKVFDANGDNRIDALDPVFNDLRLWIDANKDGRNAAGELKTLSAEGVESIELDYKVSGRTDTHGNAFRYRAKVRDTRGAQVGRWAWDVFLVKQ
jgi:hypothetical protein